MANDRFPTTKREAPLTWESGRENAPLDSFVGAQPPLLTRHRDPVIRAGLESCSRMVRAKKRVLGARVW
jgi:hypothetical protein